MNSSVMLLMHCKSHAWLVILSTLSPRFLVAVPYQSFRKVDHNLAETTWVHRIFGGRLRSRVTCRECNHNSDTFDSILDISLDIYGSSTLKDALKKFVAVDYLRGSDKYQCEK